MKGILIILVVIGHLVTSETKIHQLIYWFHMPVFFMITGILSSWGIDDLSFVKKRVSSLVVPYFSWCILLFLIFWIENPLKYLGRILYGGAMNTTAYTYPFWFVCALFVSSIVFNWFKRRNVKWLYGVLTIFLLLWYTVLCRCQIPPLPWSIEVIPFVLLYFVIGIYANKLSEKNLIAPVIISMILVIVLILCLHNGIIDYKLGMKSHHLTNILFDTIVPTIFFFSLKEICLVLSKIKILNSLLSFIGKASLVIMFIHVTILHIMNKLNIADSYSLDLLKVLVVSLVGCLVYMMCQKNKKVSLLFLGK